jgi:hypothetical protein
MSEGILMSMDLTLMDVAQESGCIRIIKKPNFVYVDFDSKLNKCLLYVVNTKSCWEWDKFNGGLCKINEQSPRTVTSSAVILRLMPCHGISLGTTGIYRAEEKRFFAIKLKSAFHIQDLSTGFKVASGEKGDWLISDGNINTILTDDSLRRGFALDLKYNYLVKNVSPQQRKETKKIDREFSFLTLVK